MGRRDLSTEVEMTIESRPLFESLQMTFFYFRLTIYFTFRS
jgi:hypothetical protein